MRSKKLFALSILAAAMVTTIAVAVADDPPAPREEVSPDARQRRGAAERPARGPDDTRRVKVEYRGLLQDENDQPISGVFALDFKIYDRSISATPLWSERHFVAVVSGEYLAPLGAHRPLNTSHVDGERWIGIELVGEGEILRDRLVIREPSVTIPVATAGSGARVAFSDVADRALEADRARVAESAERLGNLSLTEIERLSNLALERLGEHIADPNAHQGGAGRPGGALGTERRVMEIVGGRGGTPFDVRCPRGFVVTGIEGSAGRVVDGIRIVCSPLQ
jgi:hypothetical protein